MEDPVNNISDIVHRLTQGSPRIQEQTINEYFTPNASFTHPFCRTGSFDGSRRLVHAIFRWYKVMSPRIDLTITSIAYDPQNHLLYLTISQIFAIWFIPFHRAPVTLTTVLQLVPSSPSTSPPMPTKYFIQSQNDLYQVDQFVRFFAPWGIGTSAVLLWHFTATFFCVVLAYLTTPFTAMMQVYDERAQREGEGGQRRRLRGREFTPETARTIGAGDAETSSSNGMSKHQFGSMQVVNPKVD